MYISNKLTTVIIAVSTVSLVMFTACRKQKDTEDTGYGTDHAALEKTFSDVQSITDQAGTDGGLSTYKMLPTLLGSCAVVTKDTVSNPHVATIDFGATNCLSADGKYRRGKIIVTYTGRYRDVGSMHTITFDNYFVNDNEVKGTKTVTNTGTNSSGQPVFNINVNGSIVLSNGNGTLSWTSTRTRTWITGYNSGDWKDDVYEITGSGTVTRASGKTFDMAIITPLHIALDCKWIQSGVVQITPQGGNVRSLDYGNGTCDDQADLTVNGKTYSISLR